MDFAAHVKTSVDIVRVIGEYVRLKRVGNTPSHTGLCPFHTEKTPSFRVHADHQFYKCFGCGEGGDVFKFVMKIENLSFPEALKKLAEQHGIPQPKRSEYADEETKARAAVYRMHEIAVEVFRQSLRSGAGSEARAYLERRGLNASQIEQFDLGYSERGGQALTRILDKEGFSREQLALSGLVMERQDGSGFFDRFRNRLMFPIHNESAKVIGFGGRALSAQEEPKYLNSPETPIYKKSSVLFNLNRAKESIRKNNRAVLVEGYMDVIGVWGAGVHEVVASCGTALTTQQIQALKRHSERIVVNFDPDTAGANAAERSIQLLLEEGMETRILQLDGELDPDEYCKERGAEAYMAQLSGARDYFLWLGDRARERFDVRTPEGADHAFQFLLPAIARVPDDLKRAAIANEVASYLGVRQGMVLERFRKAAAGRKPSAVKTEIDAPHYIENTLLPILVRDADARKQLAPGLLRIETLRRFATWKIFEQILALEDSGADFGFSELRARLDEPDQAKLDRILLREDVEVSFEQATECLVALERQERLERVAELRKRIRETSQKGEMAEAMQLTQQLDRLQGR
ncbi:MAG: DNA primase [Bryobacteraceae bacterium]